MCVDDTFKVLCKWMFQQKLCVDDDKSKHGCCFIHNTWGILFAQTCYVCFYRWHFLKEDKVLRPDSLCQKEICAKKLCIYTTPFFFPPCFPIVARFLFYAFWFATFWGEKHESHHMQTLSSLRLPKNSRILENPLWAVAKFGSFFLWMVATMATLQNCQKKKKNTHWPPPWGPLPYKGFFSPPKFVR
jgi:hypothetical protein